MKIFFVSTSYPERLQDWQGSFIKNLLFSLAKKDGLSLNLWSPHGEMPQGVNYNPLPGEAAWLKDLMDSGGIAHVIRSQPLKSITTIAHLLYLLRKAYVRGREADIFHVNWLQNILPLWGIWKPTVVSVLGNDFGLLSLPGMTRVLRSVISQRRCILAPNGEWMVPGLEERFGDIAQVRYIPFGVDSSWFGVERTPDLCAARKWLAVSRLTKNKIGTLFDWGEGVFGRGDELHLIGPMQEEMNIPHWVHYHGPATPAQLRDQWYPRVAGLITLSQHDEGRPQVILEAMASGIPILASDLSAHNTVITHRRTGFLARTQEDLTEGIRWLSLPQNNARTGEAAREWIRNEIGTWDDCAARYARAYEAVLDARPLSRGEKPESPSGA